MADPANYNGPCHNTIIHMTDFRTRLNELKTDLGLLLEQYADVVDFKTTAETYGAIGFSEPPSTEDLVRMRMNG